MNHNNTLKILIYPVLILTLFWADLAIAQDESSGLNIAITGADQTLAPALKIVALLTVLSVAPAILLMMTSFTRIVIVLGFIRLALGTQTMPPNQVIVGLSLFLTLFTMQPVLDRVKTTALDPYFSNTLAGEVALEQGMQPIREFMLSQTRKDDLGLLYRISGGDKPNDPSDVPNSVLLPAFMISELKTAFNIGFIIYIPFLVIDMVVSSILMAMGMMMLPPTVVSLPFKLILFVLVDGWSLIVDSLVGSFHL